MSQKKKFDAREEVSMAKLKEYKNITHVLEDSLDDDVEFETDYDYSDEE